MAPANPSADFAAARLSLATVDPGARFQRIYHRRFPDPLGVGKAPSRFSDPRRRVPDHRFGVLYLGSSLRVCFLEALLRDQRDGVVGDWLMEEAELDTRQVAEVEVQEPLTLLDLRDGHPVRMGIPSDVVRGASHALSRRWSAAFHDHPGQVDGLIYPSRLNGETNLAIYDRAITKITAAGALPLKRAHGLPAVLDEFEVGLI